MVAISLFFPVTARDQTLRGSDTSVFWVTIGFGRHYTFFTISSMQLAMAADSFTMVE